MLRARPQVPNRINAPPHWGQATLLYLGKHGGGGVAFERVRFVSFMFTGHGKEATKMVVEAPKAVGRWITPLVLVASVAAAAADLRLVDAVKNRDRAAARTLLTQKIDVNIAQPDGATALHWAAHWDDLETADLLIRARAPGERRQRLWRHAALARVHEWQRRHGRQAAEGGGESHRRAPVRGDAPDDVRAVGEGGGGPAAAGPRRGRQRERNLARANRVDVGGGGRPCRRRAAADREPRRHPGDDRRTGSPRCSLRPGRAISTRPASC